MRRLLYPCRLRRAAVWMGATLSWPLLACSGADPTTSAASTLEVQIALKGNSTDANGVYVRVTPESGASTLVSSVAPGGTKTLDVAPGMYTVSMTDLADHCWAEGPSDAVVEVLEGIPAEMTFETTCVGDFAFKEGGTVVYLGADGRRTEHPLDGLTYVHGWDPSGSVVLVEQMLAPKCDLWLFDPQTGGAKRVGDPAFSYDWPWPVWSPAGDRLVVVRMRGCREQSEPAVEAFLLYDQTGTVAIDSMPGRAWGMAWRPGTDQLTYTNGTGIRLHDWTTGADSLFSSELGTDLSWSPDGGRLAVDVRNAAQEQQILVLDAEANELFRVGGSAYAATLAIWAPDVSGFLFVGPGPSGRSDLYWVAADGSGERPVTANDGSDDDPNWVPAGGYFLYTSGTIDNYLTVHVGDRLGEVRKRLTTFSGSGSARFRPGTTLDLD